MDFWSQVFWHPLWGSSILFAQSNYSFSKASVVELSISFLFLLSISIGHNSYYTLGHKGKWLLQRMTSTCRAYCPLCRQNRRAPLWILEPTLLGVCEFYCAHRRPGPKSSLQWAWSVLYAPLLLGQCDSVILMVSKYLRLTEMLSNLVLNSQEITMLHISNDFVEK